VALKTSRQRIGAQGNIVFNRKIIYHEKEQQMKTKPKKELIQIRVTPEEKAELREKAKEAGFSNISEYLRVTGKKRHRG